MAKKKATDEIGDSLALDEKSKLDLIAKAQAKIEKDFGVSVFQLKEKKFEPVKVLPTGVLSLDRAMKVFGFPKGRVVELYGENGSGKTMLALLAIGECQRAGGRAAFIDMECTYDESFANLLGVNHKELFYAMPETAEKALDTINELAQTGAFDIIVIDSVANMVPKEELEGTMEKQQVGLLARVMSKGLRKLTNTLARTETCMVFINQIRLKVGVMFGDPRTTPGGKALAFYSSMRIEVSAAGKDAKIKDGDTIIGHKAKIVVRKNKVGPPFGEGSVSIYYGKGIDVVKDVCTVAKEEGIIDGTSWLSYTSLAFTNGDGESLFKMQGLDNFVEAMRSRLDVVQEIKDRVIQKIKDETMAYQQNRDLKTEEQKEASEVGVVEN